MVQFVAGTEVVQSEMGLLTFWSRVRSIKSLVIGMIKYMTGRQEL